MRTLVIFCFVLAALTSSEANAQYTQQNRIRNYSAFSQTSSGFRSTATQILSRPTTSPYLALTDLNGQGIDTSRNYFTQVRPALERQDQQRRQQLQIQNIQQNVTQLRSQAARQNVTGPRGTGHPTRFNFYMHYYPGLNRR